MNEPRPIDRALAMVRAGKRIEAERAMQEYVSLKRDREGRESVAHAQAMFELATVMLAVGDFTRGAETLREVCALSLPGDDGARASLTYNMNLGEVLTRMGQVDEAEAVLRDGLSRRVDHYGEDHPGYAFGLAPLIDVLLVKGAAEEAEPMVDRAVAIYLEAGHPSLGEALVQRAYVRAALSRDELFETLSDEARAGVLAAVMRRAPVGDPSVSLRVLSALRDEVQAATAKADRAAEGKDDSAADDNDALFQLNAAITNAARASGDHAARQRAFRWLVANAADNDERCLQATLGLALAQSDAGDDAAADKTYSNAHAIAQRIGPLAFSQLLRNHGLFLAESARPRAAVLMERALTIAREHDAEEPEQPARREALGRALVAFGIFKQHGDEADEAKALLHEAIATLPTEHPDALPARSHLAAMESGEGCGCGNMEGALSDALMELVRPHVADGLLAKLTYSMDGNVKVELQRKPSDREMEEMNRAIHQAVATLQSRIRSSGYG